MYNNLETLINQCGKKHTINKNSPILPFTTRNNSRAKFDNGFTPIIGEFARVYSNKELNDDFNIEQIVDEITNQDNITQEVDNIILKEVIQEYLLNEKVNINILHPKLFLYLNDVSKNNKKSKNNEKDIALFIRDVLFKNMDDFDFFNNNEVDNVLIKLILSNLPHLEDKETQHKFYTCLDFIPKIFKEDMEFLEDKTEFLISNIEKIIAFYYFFYCSQLILKLNQGYDVDLNKEEEVYYLLDWEISNKNRESVKSGYKVIKERAEKSLIYINLIEQLNILAGTNGLLPNQIYQEYESMNDLNKREFIEALNEWIKYYNNNYNIKNYRYSDDFETLVGTLKESLELGISGESRGKQNSALFNHYRDNLQTFANKYFIKNRGRHGKVLNMNKDFLYLLTAMCIKNKKIKLKQLFQEYERRGVYFDRYSKDKIVILLNKWNLIDKKSDSGDAQYVKAIL